MSESLNSNESNFRRPSADRRKSAFQAIEQTTRQKTNTPPQIKQTQTFLEHFEQQAKQAPQQAAIRSQNHELSYQDLNEQANQLAHYLQKQGVTTETLVAICMSRQPNFIIGILAIFKLGATYLPIDPEYPAQRTQYLFKDSKPGFTLACNATQEHLNQLTTNVINIDTIGPDIQKEKRSDLSLNIDPDSIAYIIYTSGSTGNPKGTLNTYASTHVLADALSKYLGLSAADITFVAASFSYDASLMESLPGLFAGSTLYLSSKDETKLGKGLRETIINQNISIALLTPSLLKVMPPFETHALRYLITGGEHCSQNIIEKWGAHVKLLNAYGVSETGVCNTISTPLQPGQATNIGQALEGSSIYILDQNQEPVEKNVTGELYIGGSALSKGYLNRPDLTQERFLDNPFEPGTKFYKTGDLASWLPDGTIKFIGRNDSQVKIRGHRLELGEVESALLNLAIVEECAAVTKERKNRTYLVAYLVLSVKNNLETLRQIREDLKKTLPKHMIPATFVALNELPYTPNLKVDKQTLINYTAQ